MSSYHGWTHRPKADGGTDPIPGFGVIEWARWDRISTTDISVTSANNTTVSGTTDTITDADTFSITSHSTITCKKAGLYSVVGHTVWGTYDTTPRTIWVARGTSELVLVADLASDLFDPAMVAGDVRLAANDTLKLVVNQHSGSGQTLYGGGSSADTTNWFEVRYLGAVGS